LNFGHTIAHALEHVSNFKLAHGQAVALGMLVEAKAGELAGITDPGTSEALREAIVAVGLISALPDVAADAVVAATRTDKKARAGAVRYALIARLGEMARTASGEWTTPLPDDVVREALIAV
jgi:3-dehydroquinate synthase